MSKDKTKRNTAYFHLPGLFEFYELYRIFLSLFHEHREYFYDWCEIGSIYHQSYMYWVCRWTKDRKLRLNS